MLINITGNKNMNFVRNLILSLVFGGVISLAATTTQAADFKYQFTAPHGTVHGTITLGLDYKGKIEATRFTIDHYTKPNGTAIPIKKQVNFTDLDPRTITHNDFIIDNGQITNYRLDFFTNGNYKTAIVIRFNSGTAADFIDSRQFPDRRWFGHPEFALIGFIGRAPNQ